ncbi:hypothetical protein D3C71_973150 [compost metagenome]
MLHQIVQGIVHPMGIPIFLQYILQPLESDNVRERQHIITQNLIRRMVHVGIVVLFGIIPKSSPPKHLKEAELQLLRTQIKYIVKGLAERVIILFWQACDQIEMLINLPAVLNRSDGPRQLGKVLTALDQLISIIIGGLNPNFKSEDSGRRILSQIFENLRTHNICSDLKLEYTALMILDQELEHLHGVGPVNIKRTVQEFNNLGSVTDQIENIRFHTFNIVISHPYLDTRQAELTVEGTTSACLEIYNSLAQIRNVLLKTMR